MDQRNLESWYEEYSQDVFNFLVYFNHTDDVDDLLQEVFVKAWRKAFTFQDKSSPKTWLYAIARRVSIDHYRKQKVKSWFRMQGEVQHNDTPEQRVLVKEEQSELYRAIGSLKHSYREVVLCRGILELSADETAEVLQCSPVIVNTTYHRAKAKLRDLLHAQKGVREDETAR
ncbi:RNA polymerase sigma factor [Halobacillus rhizosphaerae]|uniref:RNA polymerase sigma factor n=1 Tax=Halobacillus rhizosphaerae TaxID=3064889 RepID=UPI00398B0F94